MLIFSGSPMMAQGAPQSAVAVQLSASLDPFGLSAYFLKTSNWSVIQRNTGSIPLSGILLFNRLGVLLLSSLLLLISFKTFSFSVKEKRKKKFLDNSDEEIRSGIGDELKAIYPSQNNSRHWIALFSFTKLKGSSISLINIFIQGGQSKTPFPFE